jgi:hypothetical protein
MLPFPWKRHPFCRFQILASGDAHVNWGLIEPVVPTRISPFDAAGENDHRLWRMVPVPFKSRGAVIAKWDLRLDEADLSQNFDQPANIGLILATPSGWLVEQCPPPGAAHALIERHTVAIMDHEA